MRHITNFIFELGQLKRIKHEGWRLVGVQHPESVAEHSLRASQIAYILAQLEKYDHPEEACAIAVFHDIGECRIGDLHKVANRYVSADEERAVAEQLHNLGSMKADILSLWKQAEEKNSTAGIIAKDADLLEIAFTAKEYMEQGHAAAEDWIKNVSARLETKSAQELLETMKTMTSTDWWKGLKSFEKNQHS
ncbi:MAG: HD domain-containing protein [Nanoarchaeota archaeon]